MQKITIIGSGYVGLVSGVCFSEMGNKVSCVDIDSEKIKNLQKGLIPIYEPGLKPMIEKNIKRKNIRFTTDLKAALLESDFAFIAVGTPTGEDGSADLQYVLAVAENIGNVMEKPLIVVDKSTVPVGTADKVKGVIKNALEKRNVNINFDVVSNPEFLKEGDAIFDFMKPDRVVVGAEKKESLEKMKKLYADFFKNKDGFIGMDIRSAEMTKYAANAMLATKISFMNEVANICEKVGADANLVRKGIGSDKRIGHHFIYPGLGYGGSCFPKDVKALKKTAENFGYEAELIQAVENVNEKQKIALAQKIIKRFGEDLSKYTFGVWGLSFKPQTDDMREAPSIYILKLLVEKGAKIKAYDPQAITEAKTHYLKNVKNITYYEAKEDVLQKIDALILITEWKEFRNPDFEMLKKSMKQQIIFDGRNQYDPEELKEKNFEYHSIGRK